MAKYKNIGGPHELNDGTLVAHGDVFETEQDVLAAFPNKFVVVGDKPAAKPAPEPKAAATPAPKKADAKKAPAEDAQDVTADFDIAGEFDVRVLKDKRGWWVIDLDTVMHEAPLKKGSVAKFIADTFKE
jgi:hypothetical protein